MPVRETVEATLRFQLKLNSSEPGELAGLRLSLYAADGVRLGEEADGHWNMNPAQFAIGMSDQPFHGKEYWMTVDIRLSERELEHLERCREKNAKRDVALTLEPRTTRLVPSHSAHPTDVLDATTLGINTRGKVVSVLAAHRKDDQNLSAMILAGPDQNGALFWVHSEVSPKYTHTIASSDWIAEFAPVFGRGKFLVLEVPEPAVVGETTGDLAKRVNEAASALEKMKVDIQKGEWTQCAEDARPVVELLNRPELIRPLLETNGIQPATAEKLIQGLDGVLKYTHAFHHRAERGGEKVVPAVHAEAEDAYLAFATAGALLNLVARKLAKTSHDP